jgi:hypothetical protein
MLLYLYRQTTKEYREMKTKRSKKRREVEKELLFYLRYWKKFQPEARVKFQREIDYLVELLKEMD